jgi:hypothetical protein
VVQRRRRRVSPNMAGAIGERRPRVGGGR